MAIYESHLLRESNLDSTLHCDNCNKDFSIIRRVYGEGLGSKRSSVFWDAGTNANSQADSASLNAMIHNLSNIKDYHRCTNCGHYNLSDLPKIRKAYSKHKTNSLVLVIITSVIGILFLLLYVTHITRTKIGGHISIAVIIAIWGLIFFTGKPIKKEKWDQLVDKLNSPELVKKWLDDWNSKKTRKIIEEFLSEENVDFRKQSWKTIVSYQHAYDPPYESK